jgi:hypothetical protein
MGHRHQRDLKGGHKMSTMLQMFGRLFAGLFSAGQTQLDPDAMSLHDWADLPAHHPSGDTAPR